MVRDAPSTRKMEVRPVTAHDLGGTYQSGPIRSAPVHDQEAQFVKGKAVGPFQPAEELVEGHTLPMQMENLMFFASLAVFGK